MLRQEEYHILPAYALNRPMRLTNPKGDNEGKSKCKL